MRISQPPSPPPPPPQQQSAYAKSCAVGNSERGRGGAKEAARLESPPDLPYLTLPTYAYLRLTAEAESMGGCCQVLTVHALSKYINTDTYIYTHQAGRAGATELPHALPLLLSLSLAHTKLPAPAPAPSALSALQDCRRHDQGADGRI